MWEEEEDRERHLRHLPFPPQGGGGGPPPLVRTRTADALTQITRHQVHRESMSTYVKLLTVW